MATTSTNNTQANTKRTAKKGESKRPWILVFLNAGALVSTVAQMHHLWLLMGAR